MGIAPYRTLVACALAVSFAASVLPTSAMEEGTASAAPLKSVLGREVTTVRDGEGGRIIDVLADNEGTVRAAVVEFGGFLGIGTRKIAVDWAAFRFSGRTVQVDVSRDQLRTAPEYKSSEQPFIVGATAY